MSKNFELMQQAGKDQEIRSSIKPAPLPTMHFGNGGVRPADRKKRHQPEGPDQRPDRIGFAGHACVRLRRKYEMPMLAGAATSSTAWLAEWITGVKPFNTSYDTEGASFITSGAVVKGLGVKSSV